MMQVPWTVLDQFCQPGLQGILETQIRSPHWFVGFVASELLKATAQEIGHVSAENAALG